MRLCCVLWAGLILWPALAHADDDEAGDDDDQVIEVAPIDVHDDVRDGARDGGESGVRGLAGADPTAPGAERGLTDPAFVTVVRIDERAGETASIAEVLRATMGVNVRSLGGLGSFSSISVRGASAGNTTVLIDGVPISRVATVTADIGRYQLDAFSELELYRGAVPIDYGGTSLGGALNLITRTGPPASGHGLNLLAGTGSFGARRLRARWLDGDDQGKRGYHVSLGYSGATGDFSYFDTNGTNLVFHDDEFVVRENNGYDQVDAVARYRARSGDFTVTAGNRWHWKIQGIPGGAGGQAQSASLATMGALVDASVDKKRLLGDRIGALATGRATAFAAAERQRYSDRHGEIGLGVQDRRYQTISAGAAARAGVELGLAHLVSTGVDARFDHFSDSDALAPDSEQRTQGARVGAGVDVSDELSLGNDDRVVLVAGLRLDVLHTLPIGERDVPVPGAEDLEPRFELRPSPRLSARVRVRPGLAVKSSAGWYFRAPTMAELFGDRGFIVGNPGLVSETGLAADIGVVIAPGAAMVRGAIDRVYLEAAAFGRRSRDTIAFVAGGSPVAYSRNLGDAQAHGVEAGASLRVLRAATLSVNYTYLATRQDSPLPSFDGKPLPGRPGHQLHGRIDIARVVRGHLMVLWSDIIWTAQHFIDAAGAYPVPARRLAGAGVKLEPVRGLLVGVEIKNLTDERIEMVEYDPPLRPDLARVPQAVSDLGGFPLPGRAFHVTMEWTY